ncbi:hypothetical protein BDN67DRAFT_967484 [Paxillus ammoniavirescens]|nr:hypothetical protein BDN67DRAFT_967484 [Paxillus ammoniavirescens]
MFSMISPISPRIGFVQARSSFVLVLDHVYSGRQMKICEEVVYFAKLPSGVCCRPHCKG